MSDQPGNQAGGTSQGTSNQASGGQGQAGGQTRSAQGQQAPGPGQVQQGQYAQGGAYAQRKPPLTNVFSRPVPKQYLKFSIGSMAGAGLVLSVMAALLNFLGGFSMVPSVLQSVQGTAVVSSRIGVANGLTVSYITTELAPFIALGLSLAVVAIIALRMNDTRRNKMTTAASGVFVGAILFVIIATIVTSLVAPTVSSSMLGYSYGPGISVSQSINFGPLLLDSVVAGIACALLAAIVVYLGDSLPN